MISQPPTTWRGLQDEVARILNECGLAATTDVPVELVRGKVNVDVLALDQRTQPPSAYIIECKFWKKNVPKAVVHSFRTVVADYGANWGLIISSKGFQSGALDAASNTNIRLLSWSEFEDLFVDRWIENYLCKRIHKETERLVRLCCDPISGTRPEEFHRVGPDPENKYAMLAELVEPYLMVSLTGHQTPRQNMRSLKPVLPLDDAFVDHLRMNNLHRATWLPSDVRTATCFRDLLEAIVTNTHRAYREFDNLSADIDTCT